MHFSGRNLGAGLALALIAGGMPLVAQEKKSDAPRITAFSPVEVVPGTPVKLRIRGWKLAAATEVRFPDAAASITAIIQEKKSADAPNGMDVKDIGDSQLEVSLVVAAGLPEGAVSVTVVTPHGVTATRPLRVVNAAVLVEEKEPNGGFREAQAIEIGKRVRGVLKEDKDVDVFGFSSRAQQKLRVEVIASQCASLLDPLITVYDAHGQILGASDDATGRDPMLAVTANEGMTYVVVQDAHDRGSPWHSYELILEEAQ